jgi:hypothetical protein
MCKHSVSLEPACMFGTCLYVWNLSVCVVPVCMSITYLYVEYICKFGTSMYVCNLSVCVECVESV